MASISKQSNGHKIIQFKAADGKRRSIRLGKMSMRNTEVIKVKVEQLVAALITGHAVNDETARWLTNVGDEIYNKLVQVGLVQTREKTRLLDFLNSFIDRQKHLKPRTLDIFKRTRNNLVEFFKRDRSIDSISVGEAKEWRQHLFERGGVGDKPLALNTVNDRCKKAKQMFKSAIEYELISKNPFIGLPGNVRCNPKKLYFVSREEIVKVMDGCPDHEWRLLIALCRFAGLRNPSETISLKWEHINWEHGRMTVPSPKTEHHPGGESRVVPIFADLQPYLEEAWERASEGQEYVLNRWRSTTVNHRTQFQKIIRRAGLNPWPRLFHNLRSTCQTELEEHFPSHVVCSWIGNSIQVAREHYLQITEDHFAKAVQNAVQQPAVLSGIDLQGATGAESAIDVTTNGCEMLQKKTTECDSQSFEEVHPSGFEPLTFGFVGQQNKVPSAFCCRRKSFTEKQNE
jgi:integrase